MQVRYSLHFMILFIEKVLKWHWPHSPMSSLSRMIGSLIGKQIRAVILQGSISQNVCSEHKFLKEILPRFTVHAFMCKVPRYMHLILLNSVCFKLIWPQDLHCTYYLLPFLKYFGKSWPKTTLSFWGESASIVGMEPRRKYWVFIDLDLNTLTLLLWKSLLIILKKMLC